MSQSQPKWGTTGRARKAENIIATIQNMLPDLDLPSSTGVDIGCGNGEIAFHLSRHLHNIKGIDPEPWPHWHEFMTKSANLHLIEGAAESIPLPDSSVDIVICNQVYEHVNSPTRLITEIERILKPGGACYFAGPNLLFPIEPHVFWPFVHWLPRSLAIRLMRAAGSSAILDAHSTHYWRLHRWLGNFQIDNALPFVLHHPIIFGRRSLIWRALRFLPGRMIRLLTPFSPTFIFILRKPA
jgi:ubiquinone/menaquinone biosynthesis C-methylase UbiE